MEPVALRDILRDGRVTELPDVPETLRKEIKIKVVAAALCYDYNKVCKHFKTVPYTRDNVMALYNELEQSKRNLAWRVAYSIKKRATTAANRIAKDKDKETHQKKKCPVCKQHCHINLNASALRFGVTTEGCCVCWEENEADKDKRPAILSCGHLICEPCFDALHF